MGNRLSKITTRTGDDGTTGLGDGSRVGKDAARIAVIGDVDELNSHLGVAGSLAGRIQRYAARPQGIYLAGRLARCGAGSCMPHRLPARRAQHGGAEPG